MTASEAQLQGDRSVIDGKPRRAGVAENSSPTGPTFISTPFVAIVIFVPAEQPLQASSDVAHCDWSAPESFTQRPADGRFVKALLIDDQPLMLLALQAAVQRLGTHVKVVSVGTAAAALETLAADTEFDLVLLNRQYGAPGGFDLSAELRARHPALPVVVVSASDRSVDVLRPIDLGTTGLVPKCAGDETLFGALNTAVSDGIFLPPMMTRSHSPPARGPAATASPSVDGDVPLDEAAGDAGERAPRPLASLGLTPRQTDVLALLAQGQPNKQIARELSLSVETVKDHVAAVLRTLKVSSRIQAVLAVSQISHQAALLAWREARQGELRRL